LSGARGLDVSWGPRHDRHAIWACGNQWINVGAWVTDDLDEGEERDVEAQFAACITCWDELEQTISVSALPHEALVLPARSSRGCRNSWPPRERR
jgi:hypothetical protein